MRVDEFNKGDLAIKIEGDDQPMLIVCEFEPNKAADPIMNI